MDEQEWVEEGLSPELKAAIDRVSARLARRFAWELRLERWRNSALVASAALALFAVGQLYVLASLNLQASAARLVIARTLS